MGLNLQEDVYVGINLDPLNLEVLEGLVRETTLHEWRREEAGAQEKYKRSLSDNDSGRTMSGFTDAKRGWGFSEVAQSGQCWRDVKMDED